MTALDVPGLGLCYAIRPHIAAVAPDSPAARAGLKAGDVISAVTIAPPRFVEIAKVKGSKSETPAPKPETITFDEASPAWIKAFWNLQYSSDTTVSMVVNKGSKPIEIKAEPDPTPGPSHRGASCSCRLVQKLPPQSIAAALRRGWDDTIENIFSIYGTIRNLVLGRLGPRGLAGPIRIVGIAYKTARSSMNELIKFLGILSINLAVINFLPIPPLDGGQMLFLMAEKIRGRPLPESALGAGIVVGLVLVVCLMIFVLFQDVLWSIENWKGSLSVRHDSSEVPHGITLGATEWRRRQRHGFAVAARFLLPRSSSGWRPGILPASANLPQPICWRAWPLRPWAVTMPWGPP